MTLPTSASPEGPSRDAARAAKSSLAARLAGDARVNGVGVVRWHSSYAVRVNVVTQADAPELPEQVDGVPVRVVEIGHVTAS